MLKSLGTTWNYSNGVTLRWLGKVMITSCMATSILACCFIFNNFHKVPFTSSADPIQYQGECSPSSPTQGLITTDTIENQATSITVITQSNDHYANEFVSLSIKDTIEAIGKRFISKYNHRLSAPSCQNHPPFALLIINSAAHNFDQRRGIRKTWGNGNEFDNRFDLINVWKVIFVVGRTSKDNIDQRVNAEAKLYQDLLIINKFDNHQSLTDKTLLGMYWANQICPAKFYYKGDDDVWVNKWRLLDYFLKLSMDTNVHVDNCWIGLISRNNRVPIRDIHHKYYVSYKDYGGDRFPKYCSGFSYIMTRQTATKIITSIPFIRKIPGIDDVYIGLLANRTGIRPRHNPRFRLRNYDASEIKFDSEMLFESISEHGVYNSQDMIELQRMAKKMYPSIHNNKK